MQAKVLRLSERGFGFLQIDGRAGELYFHCSQCVGPSAFDSLQVGDVVQFLDGKDPHGRPCARRVQFVGAAMWPPE